MTQKEVKIIDSSVIWSSFRGELTVEEEKFLSEWLAEDQPHVAYYEKAKKYFEKGSSFEERPYDQVESWNKLSAHFDQTPSKKRYGFRLGIAASMLLAVSAAVFLINRKIQETPRQEIAQLIEPGSSSATLFIDGVKTHSFTENLDTSFSTTQSVIKTTGSTLEYTSSEDRPQSIATNTLVTPKGGEFTVILSDGTKVWVNADSRLSYPEVFDGRYRRVNLSGEAYFEVAHKADQPFIVENGGHEIQVLGTSFNVSAYPGDGSIATTLVEGKVMIGNQTTLEPGQQSIFLRETGMIEVSEVDVYQYVSWKDKIFYFDERKLGEILLILSRWYDFEYVIDNSDKERLLFSGGFQRHDSFESIMKKIELTNEIRFEVDDGKVRVY